MIYDIRNYGAKSDGNSLNTKAIQAAIDECCKSGGGRVLVSGGVFLTGTIILNYITKIIRIAKIVYVHRLKLPTLQFKKCYN